MSEPRDVPIPVIAFVSGTGTGRPFRRSTDAYYAIAKALVVEKYPRWLFDGGEEFLNDQLMTPNEIDSRRERAQRLFFSVDAATWVDADQAFDEKLWRTFLRRVAKFLAFVDKRRGIRAQLENLDTKQLEKEFAYAERAAQEWMARAQAIRRYMDDRYE